MSFNAEYNSNEKTLEFTNGARVRDITKLSGIRLKGDGGTSDGYHTFDELYYHRMILFSVICKAYTDYGWKSWKHHDGTMYDDYFIVGLSTEKGDYSYHYHKDYWDMFEVKEMEFAPEWDGHKPEDITRLLSLV